MIAAFSHVTVGCRDQDRSTRFYERIGLAVTRRVGELDNSGTARAFGPKGNASGLAVDLVKWLDPSPKALRPRPSTPAASPARPSGSRTSTRPSRPCARLASSSA